MIKNQEIAAYRKDQIERDKWDFRIQTTVDKFEVETWYSDLEKCWKTRQKSREDYMKRKDEIATRKSAVDTVKYEAEIDGLKEGIRVIIKNRVTKEWRIAKFKIYEQKVQNDEQVDQSEIDSKQIEYEIDQTIYQAFE